MNEFPEDIKVQGETVEARGLRWKTEEDDLQRLLLENNVSTEASDMLIDQLARKHRTEEENNDVFPTMDDFDRYERAMSFGTSDRGEDVSPAQKTSPFHSGRNHPWSERRRCSLPPSDVSGQAGQSTYPTPQSNHYFHEARAADRLLPFSSADRALQPSPLAP